MSRIAYVNGSYVPHRDAAISIDDRGINLVMVSMRWFLSLMAKWLMKPRILIGLNDLSQSYLCPCQCLVRR